MTGTQGRTGVSLGAVRDAALERALVDGRDARRYFALAGVLDRVESGEPGESGENARIAAEARSPATQQDGDAARRSEAGSGPRSDPGSRSTTGSGTDGSATLSALLTCTIAAAAIDDAARIDESTTPNPWLPGDPGADLVAAGAVAAYRRFDVDVETVAARAGLARADLRERVRKGADAE